MLEDFYNKVLQEYLNSSLNICCLERGDKENYLHIQCAAEFRWNPEDGKGLAKKIRELLNLDNLGDLSFKLQCKVFEAGQTWQGMLGYCHKVSIILYYFNSFTY